MVTGVLDIVAAVSLRREIEGKWALLLLGVLSMVLGVAMVALPGAGLLLFFFGLGMIGTQSLLFARFMDWAESRTRGFTSRFRRV